MREIISTAGAAGVTAFGEGSDPLQHSRTRAGLLAVALLTVELVAGMQAYLLNTVMPIIGTDFDAKDFYGVIVGSAQIAMFLTMPLGPSCCSASG